MSEDAILTIWPWQRGEGRLWGLAGPAGSGKSTAAGICAQAGWARLSFAAPLRAAARELYPAWGDAHFEHPWKNEVVPGFGVSPRQVLRVIGETARRVDPDIWVLALARELRLLVARGALNVIIDDLRFDTEARFVRDLGGKVIHIRRDWQDWRRDHASEQGVEMITWADTMLANHQGADAWVRLWQSLAQAPSPAGSLGLAYPSAEEGQGLDLDRLWPDDEGDEAWRVVVPREEA